MDHRMHRLVQLRIAGDNYCLASLWNLAHRSTISTTKQTR
jgi:hypothetical protein